MSRWDIEDEAFDKLFENVDLDGGSQDEIESQEELLGTVTVAPTPERGVVTAADATSEADEGKGSGEERCTGGHSSRELPTTLPH